MVLGGLDSFWTFSSLTSSTIRSSLSLNVMFSVIGLAVLGPLRFRGVDAGPPPPMLTKPVGVLHDFLDERSKLPQNGVSHTRKRGNSMGRLVVMTATKASLVPHSPAC